jgi:hypothetical protein
MNYFLPIGMLPKCYLLIESTVSIPNVSLSSEIIFFNLYFRRILFKSDTMLIHKKDVTYAGCNFGVKRVELNISDAYLLPRITNDCIVTRCPITKIDFPNLDNWIELLPGIFKPIKFTDDQKNTLKNKEIFVNI